LIDDASLIDLHVGRRVRLQRKACGLSQQGLAQALGLTFQQVQKYECGSNRISASKLFQIAQALNVRVEFFFAGLCPRSPTVVAKGRKPAVSPMLFWPCMGGANWLRRSCKFEPRACVEGSSNSLRNWLSV
jgi:DNA-binding XRE family transcriptional regulator